MQKESSIIVEKTVVNSKRWVIKINKLALFILLIGSTFQYGDIIVSRWFIPMVSVIFCWIILFLYQNKFNKLQYQIFLFHMFSFIVFSLISYFGNSASSEYIFDLSKLFLAFSISFLSFYYITKIDLKTIIKFLIIMLYFSILFLFLELYGRFSAHGFDFSRLFQGFFYYLKFNSPFMNDSNATALYALFYMIVSIYLLQLKNNEFKKQVYIIFYLFLVFIIATFSRSVIITAFLLLFFLIYDKFDKKSKIFLSFIIAYVFVFVFIYIYHFVSSDGSGITKLNIIKQTIQIAPTLDFKGFLLGFGINEGNYVYSYERGAYSHLLFPMVLGQFGLAGLVSYTLFFTIFYFLTKGYYFIYLLAVFVVGLSYLHPFLESIFLVNGILLGLYYHKNLNKEENQNE